MKLTWSVPIVCLFLAPLGSAQRVELKLDQLKAKASEASEQNLEGAALESFLSTQLTALELAARASRDAKKEEKATTLEKSVEQIRRVAPLLTGIYMRTFEFSKEGAYAEADLEPVLRQVRRSGWSHLLETKDREDRIDVFLMSRGDQAIGLLLVVAEPDELVVVNVVGAVPLAEAKEIVSSQIHYDLNAPVTPKQ
jgi:hypothetical protein